MDANTILALTVAGIIAPWVTEVIKVVIPVDVTGKKALTLSMILSVLISGGVLWYQHALNWGDPASIFASAALVLGVASTVYQYLKKQVQNPVNKVASMIIK